MTFGSGDYRSTKYPSIVGSSYGWWHKPMDSSLAVIILTILVVMIFLFGIWFTTQYFKIWSIVEAKAVTTDQSVEIK
ncbi:MAG: hypothetical protein PHV78_03500 [Patescibacteria group bacterium]|nr:hypothetical protein [Patescibacteria group bacterium]MDD5121547.1 hypothetical protein [Patescibacteria group bacterium]MDD5396289.1 hypothetical protein [Patescibacteria group bacterium]